MPRVIVLGWMLNKGIVNVHKYFNTFTLDCLQCKMKCQSSKTLFYVSEVKNTLGQKDKKIFESNWFKVIDQRKETEVYVYFKIHILIKIIVNNFSTDI